MWVICYHKTIDGKGRVNSSPVLSFIKYPSPGSPLSVWESPSVTGVMSGGTGDIPSVLFHLTELIVSPRLAVWSVWSSSRLHLLVLRIADTEILLSAEYYCLVPSLIAWPSDCHRWRLILVSPVTEVSDVSDYLSFLLRWEVWERSPVFGLTTPALLWVNR